MSSMDDFYANNEQCFRCRVYVPRVEMRYYAGMLYCPVCYQEIMFEQREERDKMYEDARKGAMTAHRTCGNCGAYLNESGECPNCSRRGIQQSQCQKCGKFTYELYTLRGKQLCKTCYDDEGDEPRSPVGKFFMKLISIFKPKKGSGKEKKKEKRWDELLKVAEKEGLAEPRIKEDMESKEGGEIEAEEKKGAGSQDEMKKSGRGSKKKGKSGKGKNGSKKKGKSGKKEGKKEKGKGKKGEKKGKKESVDKFYGRKMKGDKKLSKNNEGDSKK